MATPSIQGIFGLDVAGIFELVAFLIFVFLIARNAGAFQGLLSAGGHVSVDAIKALQGR
jgi:uncharacterized membrane protein YhfC